MAKLFRQRKGQSAIEYLTTYGWMLLVIAIVGGAIFTTVQDSSNISSASGLDNFEVVQTGITDAGLEMEVRSTNAEQIENAQFTISEEDNASNSDVSTSNVTVNVGDTATVTFDNMTSADTSQEFDIEAVYDSGELDNLQDNGTLTGEYQIEN